MMADNPDPCVAELQEQLLAERKRCVELENELTNLRSLLPADMLQHGGRRPLGSDNACQLGVGPSAIISTEKSKPLMESNQQIPGTDASAKQPLRNNTFVPRKDALSTRETSFETPMTLADQTTLVTEKPIATTDGMIMDATHTNGSPPNEVTASLTDQPSSSNEYRNQVSKRSTNEKYSLNIHPYKYDDKENWSVFLYFSQTVSRRFYGFQTKRQADGVCKVIIDFVDAWKAKNEGTIPDQSSDDLETFMMKISMKVNGFKVSNGLKMTNKTSKKQTSTMLDWIEEYSTQVATFFLIAADQTRIDQLMSSSPGASVSAGQSDEPHIPDVSTLSRCVLNDTLSTLQSNGRGYCSVENCANKAYSERKCIIHGATAPPPRLCKINGCPLVAHGGGYCDGHNKQLVNGATVEEMDKAMNGKLCLPENFVIVRNRNARWTICTKDVLGRPPLQSSGYTTKEHADHAAGLVNDIVIAWTRDHNGNLPKKGSEDFAALMPCFLQAVNKYRVSINLDPTKRRRGRVTGKQQPTSEKQLVNGATVEEMDKAMNGKLCLPENFVNVGNRNACQVNKPECWRITTKEILWKPPLQSSGYTTKEHADHAAGLVNDIVNAWTDDHDGNLPEKGSDDSEALLTGVLQTVNKYRVSINLDPTKRRGGRVTGKQQPTSEKWNPIMDLEGTTDSEALPSASSGDRRGRTTKPVKDAIADDDGDSTQASEEKPATKRKRVEPRFSDSKPPATKRKSAPRSSYNKPPATKRKRVSSESGTDDSDVEALAAASAGPRRGLAASDDVDGDDFEWKSSESETDGDEDFDTESD